MSKTFAKQAMDEDKDNSDSDRALWAEITKDVTPLAGKTAPKVPKESPPASKTGQKPVSRPSKPRPEPVKAQSAETDRRTEERFRRGQMPLEATLDLHGYTRPEAYEALKLFISGAYEAGKRCVLVITGKGRQGEGPLKREVPLWLKESQQSGHVLKWTAAQPQHGGNGALYVLIRRNRAL